MIRETCVEIDRSRARALAVRHAREARRRKLRYIDRLIERFEVLNLAEEAVVPSELVIRVAELARSCGHPVALRAPDHIDVMEWMDALYEIQDALMFSDEDEEAS